MQTANQVLEALTKVVESGKALSFGLSNVPAWLASEIFCCCRGMEKRRVGGLQVQYSLLAREVEREYLRLAQENGLGVWACAPLANGLLAMGGTMSSDEPTRIASGAVTDPRVMRGSPRITRILDEIAKWGGLLGLPAATVAMAWVMHNRVIETVVVGARNAGQLGETFAARSLRLPLETLTALTLASRLPAEIPYLYFS